MSKSDTSTAAPAIHREERQLICLECAWELDALAVALPDMVRNISGAHGSYHAVRGMSARLRQLAGILMSAIGDEQETDEHLERVLKVRDAKFKEQPVMDAKIQEVRNVA